jgi:hypothetical protein
VGAVGTWAFDGTTQYIDFGEPGAGYELRSIPSVEGGHGSFAPRRRESLFDGATTAEVQIAPRRRESLFDGTTTAEVQFDPPIYVIRAQNNRPGQFGAWGYGSFSPYGSAILNTLEQKQDRPDSRPFVSRIVRNGRVLDVAFYDRNADFRTRERFEVDYDAAAGFLPHYSRSISTTPEETSVSETFLIRTQAVPGGGVVPMEWFETGFMLHEAPRQANEYDVGTEVRPSGSVWLTHFIAWDVRPQTEPVALKHVDGVQALSLPRGRVPFDPGAGAVTMARIKEAAGVKLEWPDLDRSAPLDPTRSAASRKNSPRGRPISASPPRIPGLPSRSSPRLSLSSERSPRSVRGARSCHGTKLPRAAA